MLNLSLDKELVLKTSSKELVVGDEEGILCSGDVHVALELVEVSALIGDLLLQLSQPDINTWLVVASIELRKDKCTSPAPSHGYTGILGRPRAW